jgi:hypothetical protein
MWVNVNSFGPNETYFAGYGSFGTAKCYDWFTEGFDTPDLQEAKALLEQVS